MKKFKGLKKVTALALCGIMCLGSVMTASAYSSTKYVTDGDGNMLSRVYLTKNGASFAAEMTIKKSANGNNMYSGSLTTVVYVQDTRGYNRATYNYDDSVNTYTSDNAKFNDGYVDLIINFISGKATTKNSSITLNYYQ